VVVVTTAAIRRAKSSSLIITTNKPSPNVLEAGCPSCRPANSVEALSFIFSILLNFMRSHRALADSVIMMV